jgi:hypothetical protein
MLFRWDIGLYTGLSVGLTILLFHLTKKNAQGVNKRLFTIPELSLGSGIILIIVVIFYGYIGFNSGFKNMWDQIVLYPTNGYLGVRRLPYLNYYLPSGKPLIRQPTYISLI